MSSAAQAVASPYLPIEHYGIIGDLQTVALGGMNGSIDWYCYPRFDSPSVFGALLDHERGGHFRIAPLDLGTVPKQLYFPDTNVLITRFLSPAGVGELTDFMYPGGSNRHGQLQRCLIRRVQVVRGSMRFRVDCEPAFDYGRATHETVIRPEAWCSAP